MSLAMGHNPILLDGYDNSPGVSDPSYPGTTDWEAIRKNLGYAREYAGKIDLTRAIPHPELAGTGYCLAIPGEQYLIYSPSGYGVTAHLESVSSSVTFSVEWFSTYSGTVTSTGTTVSGGQAQLLDPPHDGGDVVM